MATFNSNLIRKRTKHRGIYTGQEYTVEGVIRLPAGHVLTDSDVLRFAPLGENQVVTKVWAYIVGSLPTAQVSVGYAQRLDAAGQPEVTERYGPLASTGKFTSPASDLTAFAAAAVLSTARQPVDTATAKLAGPVDLAAAVTTGGTVGAGGVEIHVGATLIGELSDFEVEALYPDGAAEQDLI